MLIALRRTLTIIQPFVVVLAFILLALLLRSQWSALAAQPWQLHPGWLLVSGVCIVSGWLVEIFMWQRVLRVLRQHLSYWTAVVIWCASAIVRYVPGNIWQPLSLSARCQARGVRPEATIASLVLSHAIQLLAVGPIVAVYLAGWGRMSVVSQWTAGVSPWWALVVAAPAGYVMIRPASLLRIANVVLTRAGRDALPIALTSRGLFSFVGISLVAWALSAAGFVALVLAVLPSGALTRDGLPHAAAAYPMAFAVGFISLVTPSGLAVREGMLYVLLAPVVGAANALVAALGMRVWELLLDGLVSASALALSGPSPSTGEGSRH